MSDGPLQHASHGPPPPFARGRMSFSVLAARLWARAMSNSASGEWNPFVIRQSPCTKQAARQSAGGGACLWVFAKPRTKKIRRRNADRRKALLPCRRARPRLKSVRRTSIGVPPRFPSQGVFHRKGLSTRLLLPGTRRDTFCASFERALPTPACPSPANFHRAPVVVPRG